MRINSWKLRPCEVFIISVILLNLLTTFPVFGEPLTEPPQTLSEEGTKRYSDLEVDCLAELDLLIEDLTMAAREAIEKAAAEAARAAALAALEREAAAMMEARRWRLEAETAKKDGKKLAFYVGIIGLIGGFAFGIGASAIAGGR